MAKAKSTKAKAKPATQAAPVAKPKEGGQTPGKPALRANLPSKPSPKVPAKGPAVQAKAQPKPQSSAKPVASSVKPAAKSVSPSSKPAAQPAAKTALPAKPLPAVAAKPVKAPAKMDPTTPPKTSATGKPASAKSPSSKPAASKVPSRGTGTAKKAQLYPAEVAPPADGKHPFLSKAELESFRKALLNLRDRMVDEVQFLSGDNLARNSREASGDLSNYSLHMADQGTDNFDRELALNIVSGDQDTLYEIDEALRRVDNLTYGICELTQQPIEKERLKYVPHARYCMAAAKEMERGKTKYRPFGPTLSQL